MKNDRRIGWGSLVVALLIGVLIGWFAIGWGLWPVSWTGTDPVDLRQTLREDYLLMVASDYALTYDASVALDRLASWPTLADANREIRDLADFHNVQGAADKAQALQMLAQGLPLPAAQPLDQQPAVEGGGGPPSNLAGLLRALAVVAAVIGVVALTIYLLRRRRSTPPGDRLRDRLQDISAPQPPESALDAVEPEDDGLGYEFEVEPGESQLAGLPLPVAPEGTGPAAAERFVPVWSHEVVYNGEGSKFDRTYRLGEPGAEYLGECGAGATNIGLAESDRINALEVWLFDRSDIRTEARVLMSERAFANEKLRAEVSTRGKPMLAVPGTVFTLKGNRLQTEVAIEEVSYLGGDPSHNHFARVVLSLQSGKRGA